ncbi:type I restriction-modification system endonuclease [Mediterraneibacter gnavus]|mgnify:FL=1|uniref:Type I restriction-modification system endonuclease n=1 Tax=Mediterraneibacter gnavus TaxID=33038 RepID=A0AAJ3FFW6_MEDGN|nr:type I restriction-modification system endonuclease [Mediterraneibacter gnavus]NSC83932.1 type I restriction-modification system endonuclease [Mediterraneibacter gnavus]NSI26868.1 type I restriction-modification system endonuclease [Mediterraneibacter gnavus]NSI30022.1 type I restriction-modification system endonuclease [Mediterraneibacter gnavus]NSI46217.1 type I restriction-modification system endonuclease [Mediterraneibacter gnavus]NSI49701.1 type I restriction-modification system endonu
MASNFKFLETEFPVLANFGNLAEQYCYTDPNSCLMKLGMIGETIVNLMFTYDKIPIPYDNSAVNRINVLSSEGLLTRDLTDILHALRKVRNKAVHENYSESSDCPVFLQMAYSLSEWFMQTYGDWNYRHQNFVMPVKEEDKIENLVVVNKAQEEEKEEELTKAAVACAERAEQVDKKVRLKQANKMASQRQKSEAETRYMIDEQLRQVGWEANTQEIRYSKGARPTKGRNMAIAEWPTDSTVSKKGYADYALFVGTKLVGIIEAKAEHKDIPSVIDYQGKDYPRNIRKEDAKYQIATWGEFKVPFTFATNGRPYLEQFKTKSGIWFLDLREPSKVPVALHGWISPNGIMERLEKDIQAGNNALQVMPYDLLTDKDGLNLREYQVKAIKAAEKAVIDGQKEVLIAMATGTGKTRTVLGMIYRFLKTNRFKRILFLVDRTSLGDQASDVFGEVKLEELMTLDEIYNIKGLDEKTVDKETRIQVATVQSMVKRILYNEGQAMPSVTDFDLIIIDEAHRGYILDKEMCDVEVLYRDQRDYQSKYRTVVEYFDAVKIALTATPALHTTEIFGQPIFKYTYREAVIEGYLVDHDAPHHLETKLSTGGIHYKSGDTVTVYDPVTGEVTNSELLNDELDFDVENFNKQVITENFNRTVLTEIARDIDPENPEEQGKTLIYAVDDQHADMIVSILKEIYSDTGVDNNAIMKITGSVGGGNPKKVAEAIKRFKNERFPSIAVTVDLLTTGIDVPEITTLVFMRRVKSRILFEQMLGRATRLCPKIHKTHFEIYDPVGVYDSLEPVNTMKPVVTNPTTTFTQLLDGLEEVDEKDLIQAQINQIIAKLQRKKRRMDEKTMEQFISMADGMDPTQFIVEIEKQTPENAKKRLLAYRDMFEYIQQTSANGKNPVVISEEEDELTKHTRGYGNSDKPEDYLDAFSEYVTTHMNEIAALSIVCTRPKDLTRDALKALRLTLDREGFTTQQLNTAISELTNEEIAADIISLIRRYAIGSALISHEARIRRAVEKLKKAHNFSKQEMSWIGRMEKYLMEESVLNVQVFDEDSRFKSNGGFVKINKIFQNQLENIVLELNEYLYDDGGRVA